ncbi:MAG: C69 family dipeptidase [Clostridiales bacterium]|nr:C69 family dipeptidase [Clostridiales bacterium]
MKKLITAVLALAMILGLMISSASACTSIYVGSALTDDGSAIFGRSEDMSNSMNKLFFSIPAGAHKAGELYVGCYGFTWTFTHDSYACTGLSDDNGAGVDYECPDCGETHAHTPYQAAGTNEKGLTVTCTESLGASAAIKGVDPSTDEGIEEAELTTVLLSEAGSAKEALSLFFSILDSVGSNSGSGIFIADPYETWYVENLSGHQYIAVKLTSDLVMVQPNMSIIGLIDLDDTDNVIASPGIFEVAKQAGTFVGDEEANVINFVMSYVGSSSANPRMVNALDYLDPAYAGATSETIDPAASYLISNLDVNGNIVPMYTGISLSKVFTVEDVQNFYHVDQIGKAGNLDTHLFQTYAKDGVTSTVEWLAMNDTMLSVFVPYYPMLTTEVAPSYGVSTPTAVFSQDVPESGVYYATSKRMRVDGEVKMVDGYVKLPDAWADSFYWAVDALSNSVLPGGLAEDKFEEAKTALYAKQAEVNAAFADMKAAVAADPDNAAKIATDWSKGVASDVQQFIVGLTNQYLAK